MAELTIAVKAATEEATKAFKDVGRDIQDLAKKAEGFSSTGKIAFGSFIGSLASQATIGAFNLFKEGITSSVDYLRDSIKASADAEVALNNLNTSFALAGQYSKQTSDDFVKFVEGLQSVTTYEDDAIIKNAALLESFGKLSKDGLKAATTAALDFAAGTGKSLEEAFSLLAKASVGATEMLGRQGIVIKKTGDNAKDFQLVLEAINKQFGGAAAAQVDTFTGAMTQLENVYGNFKESLGSIVTENTLVISGIKALKDIFQTMQKTIEDNKDAFGNLIGQGFSALISLIPTVAKGISIIIDLFTSASNISNYFADKILGIVETFYQYRKAILEVHASIQTFLGGQAEMTNGLIADTKETIANIQDMRTAVDEEASDRIKNTEQVTSAINSFAIKAEEALRKQSENSKKLSNNETSNFLTNLSKKNEGIEALNKNAEKLQEEGSKRIEENRKLAFQYSQDLKKLREEQNKQIEGALSSGLFGKNEITDEKRLNTGQQADLARNKLIGGGLGLAGSILGGEGGAKDLLVGGASAVAEKILPGLGKAVGPILDALAQGPDAVKKFISDFVKSVPVLITNLVEAIPAVGEALIEQVPILFESLIASLPRVINALVEKIPTIANALAAQAPFIAANFAIELVKNIPYIVSSIASGAYNAIVNIFNQLNPFSSSSSVGGFLDSINPFAEGGYVKKVPNGYPNDSFPAQLSEGELVIDRSNASKLENFLNSQGDTSGILIKILDAVSSPMTVESSVQVNQQTFANIILELSRQNRRLA